MNGRCICNFYNAHWCFFRVQALILSPTRELASQTEKVIRTIGDFMNIQAHACVGGKSVGEDIRKLENGVHVVSGTPGRVCDMIKRRTLRTRAIKLLILDESDEMLSRGFKDQIYDVYRHLPPELQVPFSLSCLVFQVLLAALLILLKTPDMESPNVVTCFLRYEFVLLTCFLALF